MAELKRHNRRGGQAVVEFVAFWGLIMLPLTMGIIYVSEMYWIWHSIGELTRDVARYAATHCWESDGTNVQQYIDSHIPPTIDSQQFQTGGTATVTVAYSQIDPTDGSLVPMSCVGDCSTLCVPDVVTVSVSGYQYQRFVTYLHLPPVTIPAFPASVAIGSNGCDPEQGVCNP